MFNVTIRWKLFLWFGGVVAVILFASSSISYLKMSESIRVRTQEELETITNNILSATTIAFDNAIKTYLSTRAEMMLRVLQSIYLSVQKGERTSEEAQQLINSIIHNKESSQLEQTGSIFIVTGGGDIVVAEDVLEKSIVQTALNRKEGFINIPGRASQQLVTIGWVRYFEDWDYIICVWAIKKDLRFLTKTDYFKPFLKSLHIGEKGYSFVLNSSGDVLVHPSLEGANLYNQRDIKGNPFVKNIIDKKNGVISYYWKKPESNEIGKKLAVFRYNEDLDWLIVSSIYEDELLKPLHDQRTNMSVFIALSLVIVLITALLMSGSFTRPIRDIVSTLKRAESGDLTHRLDIQKRDEIGRTAEIINEFLDTLHTITSDIHDTTEALNSSTSDLTSISQEIYSTANQQAAAVAEVVATVEEFASMSRQMAKNASGVAQVAVETEKDVERGAGNVNSTLEKMKMIKASNDENIHELNTLRKRVEQINEVLKFINTIADQTKLIAFNATLEASSSEEGTSGKRFGIVAIEIRRLAEGIVEQTRDIEDTINEITKATHELLISFEQSSTRIVEGYRQAEETANVLETILSGSKETRKASRQIDSGTSQQQVALDQIVNTLKEISETVQHFVGATKQSDEIIQHINEISERFKDTVSHFRLISTKQ